MGASYFLSIALELTQNNLGKGQMAMPLSLSHPMSIVHRWLFMYWQGSRVGIVTVLRSDRVS